MSMHDGCTIVYALVRQNTRRNINLFIGLIITHLTRYGWNSVWNEIRI